MLCASKVGDMFPFNDLALTMSFSRLLFGKHGPTSTLLLPSSTYIVNIIKNYIYSTFLLRHACFQYAFSIDLQFKELVTFFTNLFFSFCIFAGPKRGRPKGGFLIPIHAITAYKSCPCNNCLSLYKSCPCYNRLIPL